MISKTPIIPMMNDKIIKKLGSLKLPSFIEKVYILAPTPIIAKPIKAIPNPVPILPKNCKKLM